MFRLLLLVLIIPFVAFAQPKVHFTLLNQESGLRSSDVMCFEQDKHGFIWIGTKYGLNVYDGKQFSVYQMEQSAMPFNSDISSLRNDGNSMWIGTLGDGLFVFDINKKKTQQVILLADNKAVNNINCIVKNNDLLYVGTQFGVFLIDKALNVSLLNFGMAKLNVSSIQFVNNKIIVGTQNRGVLFANEQFKIIKRMLNNVQVSALQLINNNHLLIGTKSTGLLGVDLNDTSNMVLDYRHHFNDNTPIINKVLTDKSATIWIGTDGDGLYHFSFDDQGLHKIANYRHSDKNRNSIASNAIFSLFQDEAEQIWIGTIWKGLNILDQSNANAIFYYSDYFGVAPYPVLSVFKNNNELWLGTDGKGLNIIDLKNEALSNYSTQSTISIPGDYIQTIFNDSYGKMWLGTFGSGLICFDKKLGAQQVFKNIKSNNKSISYNDVRTILEDSDGNLWIATWGGGLNKFVRSLNEFEHYGFMEDAALTHLSDNITTLCFSADKKGIWVGTFGNGLFYFSIKDKQFRAISSDDFQTLKILTLHLDSRNQLWIGTWGTGVKVLNTTTESAVEYGGLNVVSSSRITSIVEDNYQHIWMSSKDGIMKFNTQDNTLFKYGGFNLISNKEFHINALHKQPNGDLYFGGIEGVVAIKPSDEMLSLKVNTPILTRLNLYNENKHFEQLNTTSLKDRIRLAHNQNYFTLSYSSPQFTTSNVYYSYKMEGLKNEWITTSSNQTTFTNIAPGNYAFSVRSSLNNYQWSEPATVYIYIQQPMWKRWYAYLSYVASFVLLLFLFQKYAREKEALLSDLKIEMLTREKEKELHQIKHRFFTNISHEIRTPVTLIIGAANKLTELGAVPKIYEKEVGVMRSSSRHLLNLINELLDFRRLEMDGIQLKVAEGNFVKFVHEIYLSFQVQASNHNIDYRFLSRMEHITLWFDRDQMEKVIYNIISNAFKYTPSGGEITVEVDNDDQHGFLRIIDSGKGMEKDQMAEIFKRFYQSDNAAKIRQTGYGLGLSIAKEIVLLHGGEIDAQNNNDRGICIAVKIPIGNHHFTAEQQLKDFANSENMSGYLALDEAMASSVSLSEYSESTLLIVEDNAQILDYVRGLFTDIATVYTAVNGSEGLDLAMDKIPDLIISDVMMPVMDGVTMTKKLKTSVKTSHIPIILLTARTNLIFKKEGFEVGADEYITKPFNETLLRTRVYNLLKSRRQLSERLLKEYISKPQEELGISTPDQKFLSDLTHIIEKNIHENVINAKLVSDELCMSHSVIYKKIKALTGLSMIEFIRDFKLKRAAILLAKYQMSVTDVCYKVGFSDRRYFSKLFKAKFNQSPSEYAKSKGDI